MVVVEKRKFYKNIKTGKTYQVMSIGTHTETGEQLVSYERVDQYNPETHFRPLELFQEKFIGVGQL